MVTGKAMSLLRVAILSLECFDDAALALEEIEPEDKTRNEVLGARVGLYMAAKKWDMAAAVASHLVKVDPETAGWWISLAYAVRRTESVEKAEAILLQAQAIHPKASHVGVVLDSQTDDNGRGSADMSRPPILSTSAIKQGHISSKRSHSGLRSV